jgi:hypothetical protein
MSTMYDLVVVGAGMDRYIPIFLPAARLLVSKQAGMAWSPQRHTSNSILARKFWFSKQRALVVAHGAKIDFILALKATTSLIRMNIQIFP